VTAIAVEHLTHRFGAVVAVDDVGFEVGAGEVVALLGRNGAGKTTTLEILEGYLAPSAGAVSVLGVDPRRGDRRWRARIGLVMQSTSLDPELTVPEALRVFGGLFAAPRPAGELLDLIDLAARRPTRASVASRAANSDGSTSAWASSAGPRCCSSTSPPPGSTRRRADRPGRSSSASPTAAPRSS
jgi:ABC-2 type transport system ATP-binding protein